MTTTTGTKDNNHSTAELIRAGIEAKDGAQKLWTSLRAAAGLAQHAAKEQLGDRPYVTLGVAAGAGFVLAGGLASTLTRTLVAAGTKLATATLVEQIAAAVEAPDPTKDGA